MKIQITITKVDGETRMDFDYKGHHYSQTGHRKDLEIMAPRTIANEEALPFLDPKVQKFSENKKYFEVYYRTLKEIEIEYI